MSQPINCPKCKDTTIVDLSPVGFYCARCIRYFFPTTTTRGSTDQPPQPIDPKGEAGKTKPQLYLIPPEANAHMAAALVDGANKYGAFNWRTPGTRIKKSTYISAIRRHLDAYLDGEENAQDSGVSHLGHILANCAILLDAKKAGTLHDDLI